MLPARRNVFVLKGVVGNVSKCWMFNSVPPFWVMGILGVMMLLVTPVLVPYPASQMAG